jgi:hypothetical protein
VFTLRNLRPRLPAGDQELTDTLIARALPVLEKFRNRKGRPTYNFWQTDTLVVFPNSGWLNWFNESHALPDDMDDTAIGLLATAADSSQARAVHQYMQGFANSPGKRINNTFPKYRDIPAYSVWFGKNFPVDFDLCVLSNVLYFVSAYHLPFSGPDSASVQLIDRVLTSKEHLTHPHYIAPHYSTTPIILYHLSRLMQLNPSLLATHRPALIQQATEAYLQSGNIIEKAMLATSLRNWGTAEPAAPLVAIHGNPWQVLEQNDFVFFIANMASMLPDTFKKLLGNWGIGRFNYYCPAYNLALVLEYAVNRPAGS